MTHVSEIAKGNITINNGHIHKTVFGAFFAAGMAVLLYKDAVYKKLL